MKKQSTGSKIKEKEHNKKDAEGTAEDDSQRTAMEKLIKDKTGEENRLKGKTDKTGITGFNPLGFDGSKRVSGQRAFAKKRSAMSHYITKK